MISILIASVIVVPIFHLSVIAEPPPAWDPEAFDYVETGFPVNGDWVFNLEDGFEGDGSQGTVELIDEKGRRRSLPFEVDGRRLIVRAPGDGYRAGGYYQLIIDKQLIKGRNHEVRIGFIVEREEQETIKWRDDMIPIDKKDLVEINKKQVTVKKSADESRLEVGDLITVPAKDEAHPEASPYEARRVVDIEQRSGEVVLTTDEPDFIELFEELNIYHTYSPGQDDVIFLPADGVEMERLSSYFPDQRTASLLPLPTARASAYHELTISGSDITKSSVRTSSNAEGVKISLSGIDLKYAELEGTLTLKPMVTLDVDLDMEGVRRFNFDYRQDAQMDVTLTNTKPSKGYADQVYLGRMIIPTHVPGLVIDVGLYLYLDAQIGGRPQLVVSYSRLDHYGVVKRGGGFKTYGQHKPDLKVTLEGKAKADLRTGVGVSAGLEALKVVGTGLDLEAGFYGTGVSYGRADLLRGDIDGCYQIEAGAEGKIDFDVSLARNTRLETLLFQHSLAQGKMKLVELNTCQKIVDLEVEPTPIRITEGSQVQLDVKGTKWDLLSDQKEKGVPVDFQSLKVHVKDDRAITVTSTGIVTASENSPVGETVLTLSYEKASVEVPVYIYEHGEDAFHGEDDYGGEMSRYEKIARRVTKIQETLKKLYESNGWRLDERLVEEKMVGNIITKHFFTKFDPHFQGYYHNYMGTDDVLFPEEIHPDFRLRVVKESADELVMDTAEFGNWLQQGGMLRLTFKKENGKWLVHDLKYIGPLNAHPQEVKNYFSADYDYLGEYRDHDYVGERGLSPVTVLVFKHRFNDEHIGFVLENGRVIEFDEKPPIPGLRE